MTFTDFIATYDRPGAIILLEGKRAVLPEDEPKLVALGKKLAERTQHVTFRSGNAPGADYLFSQGVNLIRNQLQVITPYSNHRKKANYAQETFSLEDINLLEEPEVVFHTKTNPNNRKLIDTYLSGKRDRIAIKAAYLLRDTVKVIGASTILPATFAIFYDDLQNPMQGGTGHTIRTCIQSEIPWINQQTWFGWL